MECPPPGHAPAHLPAHPDRAAATLAQLGSGAVAGGHRPPGRDARDCRIDHKLLLHRARHAVATAPAAAARLAALAETDHPDLWAGTVRDGAARGFAAALEEAISLGKSAAEDPFAAVPDAATFTTGLALRRRKEVLIAAAGSRVRFSRKFGVLFVARDEAIHSENCLRFEAQRDLGCLDEFVAPTDERPRLFSAQFVPPVELVEAPGFARLTLAGRLGRSGEGFDCRVTLLGRRDHDRVRVRIELNSPPLGWRLRARFLGIAPEAIHHACTDVAEAVTAPGGRFCAYTLVRTCARLRCGDGWVATPGAAEFVRLTHDFELGA